MMTAARGEAPVARRRGRLIAMLGLGAVIAVSSCSTRTGSTSVDPALPSETVEAAVESPPHVASSIVDVEVARDGGNLVDGACRLGPVTGSPIGTVALTDDVSANRAPHPTNTSERILFRQVYETLLRVDCLGWPRPALAESWRLDRTGRTWVLTLRSGAAFTDGTPVTSYDVLTSWTLDGGGGLRSSVGHHVREAVAVDERVLGVSLRQPGPAAVRALADPDLAVSKRIDTSWPLGSRGTRLEDDRGRSASGVRAGTIRLVVDTPVGSGSVDSGYPAPRFLVEPGADPRDLVDRGVDLMLSRDPALLEYAETLSRFDIQPLGWQHTQVLVMPRRSDTASPLGPAARQRLADDAVRGEARGADVSPWQRALESCDLGGSGAPLPVAPDGRVLYPMANAAARDLAERLVGVSRGTGDEAEALAASLRSDGAATRFQRAEGVGGNELSVALRTGEASAYVVELDRSAADPCVELRKLSVATGWLTRSAVVPLVDTRHRVVLRRSHAGPTVEWDGGVLLEP